MSALVHSFEVLTAPDGGRCELYVVQRGPDQPSFVYSYAGPEGGWPRRTRPQGPVEDPRCAEFIKSSISTALQRRGYRPSSRAPVWRFYALSRLQPRREA